jgi:predicted nucleic acid-binding protein
VETMPGEFRVEIIALRSGYSALSLNDVAAFVLARNLGVGLLTGDRRLRALAEQSGVEVHGTLWLLERMITHELIAPSQAVAALDAMLGAGSRLPAAEVQKFKRRRQ